MSNWTEPQSTEQAHEFIDLSGESGSFTFYVESTKAFQTGYEYFFEYSLIWSGSGLNRPALQLINSGGTIRNGSQYVMNGDTVNSARLLLIETSQDEGEAVGSGYFFNAADSSLFTHAVWETSVLDDNGSSQNTHKTFASSAHCTIVESHTKFRLESYGTTYASGSYIRVLKRKILL